MLDAFGQASEVTARGDRADEHAGVLGVPPHSDPVAEHRAPGERARRIDGSNGHRSSALAQLGYESIDQR